MRTVDIIAKKRDGQVLSQDEIKWFVDSYTSDAIPDYQVAAWLMAIYLNGMTDEETTALTMALVDSGERLDLSNITDYAVDKHSSGGVGDKTSLVVLPLVAACGVPVAKMSGRGLGHSGGTLDKIESFPGFKVALNEQEFLQIARENGLVLAGQTSDLAPADGKLYALRDVTGTVASLPLIASSIMSKKIASGAQGIVLDVKAGYGAFMQQIEEAQKLAQLMVAIGRNVGRDMTALISDMNQPLGHAVGNILEVKEALDTLNGGGPDDFLEHCLVVAAHMLRLAGQKQRWEDIDETVDVLRQMLSEGAALDKFRSMISAQHGDATYVNNPQKLPSAQHVETIYADKTGYIQEVRADKIALASLELGAGRQKKGDPIDLSVGVIVTVKVGDQVTQGAKIGEIHANDEAMLESAKSQLISGITYTDNTVESLPLFYDVIYDH